MAPKKNKIQTPTIYQNPFMSENDFNSVHCDIYQTDTTSTRGPGRKGQQYTEDVLIPEPGTGTIGFDANDRMVLLRTILDLSGGYVAAVESRIMLIDHENLNTLDSVTLPGSSSYFYIDNENRVVTAAAKSIYVYAIVGDQLQSTQTYSLASIIGTGDNISSALPDSYGNIWFASTLGVVGYVIPSSGAYFSTTLAMSGGLVNELILKSIALDEIGGAYIVSNYALYRFEAHADTHQPIVSWRTIYDRGTRIKSGQVFQGCGTTPTLFNDFDGNKFVTIADNADPYTHVNVYNRLTGELVSQTEVFKKLPYANSTYNSLIAINHSVIIENNYGNMGVGEGKPVFITTTDDLSTLPGMARVDFNPNDGTSEVVWENYDISIPSAISRLSTEDGLVYTYAKDDKGWYFAALSYTDGKIINKVRVRSKNGIMQGLLANNFYSGVGNNRARDMFVPTIGGLCVWRYR